jgi:hypothetical protein
MLKNALLNNIVTTLIGLFGAIAVEAANYLQAQPSPVLHIIAGVILVLGAAAKDAGPAPKKDPAPTSIASSVMKAGLVLLCLLPAIARAAPVMIEHHGYAAPKDGLTKDTLPTTLDTSTCAPGLGGLICPGLSLSLARLHFDGTVDVAVDPGVGVVAVYGTGISQFGIGLYGSLGTTTGEQGGALSVIISVLDGYLDLGIGGRLVGDTTVFDSGKNAYLFTSVNLLKVAGITQ